MEEKLYLINFNFRSGEYEVSLQRLIKDESTDKDSVAHDYLMDYYGNTEYNEDESTYEISCGEAVLTLNEIKEISKEEYNILSKYLQ